MDTRFILELLTFLADLGILFVLILEFNYDKIQLEKQHFKKRTKRERYKFESLTTGESK